MARPPRTPRQPTTRSTSYASGEDTAIPCRLSPAACDLSSKDVLAKRHEARRSIHSFTHTERPMKTRVLFLMTAVLTLGLVSFTAAETAKPKIEVPDMPGDLVVPEGNEPFLVGQATGTQNYICMPAATGVAWKFLGPQATLFLPVHGGHLQNRSRRISSARTRRRVARRERPGSIRSTAAGCGRSPSTHRCELRRAGRDSVAAVGEGRYRRRTGRRRDAGADHVHSARQHAGRHRAGDRLQRGGQHRRVRARAVQHRLLLLSRGG